ncbi:hypothetical protein CGZ98_14955 [Enemella evansiae]|nr:hypothetical protein CGZ98_14955 [Enemella evansiae]
MQDPRKSPTRSQQRVPYGTTGNKWRFRRGVIRHKCWSWPVVAMTIESSECQQEEEKMSVVQSLNSMGRVRHGAHRARLALAGYGVESNRLRDIAASLPTGVTVISTTDAHGTPHGMTSGAVCSVSAEPPLLLTSLGRGSRTLGVLLDRGAFVVNILHGAAAETSQLFATSGADRFAGVSWHRSRDGLPVLDREVVAHAECQVYEVVPAGDHVVVIGLVTDGLVHQDDRFGDPLLYFRRAYAGWAAKSAASDARSAPR